MIPLGGYVKMLDEREGDVPSEQAHLAFNNKNVWQRIAIVAAGPLVNFIFAILAYWVLFVSGVSSVVPLIGSVTENSIAEQMQLPLKGEIVAVDNRDVSTWVDINLALASRIGESQNLTLKVKGGEGYSKYSVKEYRASLDQWNFDLEKQSPLSALGITPFRPIVEPVIATVLSEGRAQSGGFRSV